VAAVEGEPPDVSEGGAVGATEGEAFPLGEALPPLPDALAVALPLPPVAQAVWEALAAAENVGERDARPERLAAPLPVAAAVSVPDAVAVFATAGLRVAPPLTAAVAVRLPLPEALGQGEGVCD
jgi:hypothetical protein